LVAAATLSYGFSQGNSGLWTPTIVKPARSYRSCHARNCGITFWQLIQPYVQNSTSTTRPLSSAMLRGGLLIHPPPPVTSGAAWPTRTDWAPDHPLAATVASA